MRQGPVTQLLTRHRTGDAQAYDELVRIVSPDIRAMAQRRARGSAELGASTLVSETFLKFLSSDSVQPGDKAQFFGLMATIMRQVIIDEARAVGRLKRAGQAVTLDEEVVADDSAERAQFLIQVDEIATRLEETDPEMCRVFELRFFAGLTNKETAEALDKERPSLLGLAGVVELRDARVIETGEDLAFRLEPLAETDDCRALGHELDRDGALEVAGRPLGPHHQAHAAAAEEARDPVASDRPAGQLAYPLRFGIRQGCHGATGFQPLVPAVRHLLIPRFEPGQ